MERSEVINIAHRGFSSRAPENTLAAARLAHRAGAGAWELDVAASRDGELVVLHDDSLVRTTDAGQRFPGREPWLVYDFSLAELRSLDAGSWFAKLDRFGEVAAGRVGAAELAGYAKETLPTLREALEYTRSLGWKVNVEIKDARGQLCDAWIVEKTIALIRELELVDSVILSSFNHDYLAQAALIEPRLDRAALVEEEPEGLLALLKRLKARAYHPRLGSLKEATARTVRGAGFDLNVWTVDEEADMKRLIAWGATGLITNRPDRACALLGKP